MTQLTTAEVIRAWTSDYAATVSEANGLVAQEFRLSETLLQLLAEGKPVSADQVAARSGLSLEQVKAVFDSFAGRGGEFDEDGNLVGAALTLNPTGHRLIIEGRQLFAWCSLDAIFLPGLIGKTAEVGSTDPTSGELIRLTVTPDGVAAHHPSTTVLSITVPGLSCRTKESCGPETGPSSEACSQMHFFASRANAEAWLKDHPGVAILTVDEAWQLAKANWLDRHERPQAGGSEQVTCAC